MRRTVAETVLWWAILFVLYLLFISAVDTVELVVGAAAALFGGVAAHVVRRTSRADFGGGARAWAAVWALPANVLADTARLAAAAVRGEPGKFRDVPVARGTGPSWATVLLSVSPGAYAVDVRRPEGRQQGAIVTVHVLCTRPGPVERALAAPGPR